MWRFTYHRLALAAGGIARAHGDSHIRQSYIQRPRRLANTGQRHAQITFDVIVQRFERRDIEQLQPFAGRVAAKKLVDAPEKGRQRFAGTRRGEDQRVVTTLDRGPAQCLGWRWLA